MTGKGKKKANKTRRNAGETLVEVLASMFIFLIMFGILQGAVSYSSQAMKKNRQIRQENAQIFKNLQSASEKKEKQTKLSFQAVDLDSSRKGEQVVFQVKTQLVSREVAYTDANGTEQKTTFYMYSKKKIATDDDSPEVNAGD